MATPRLSLDALVVLEAVARHASFSKAAIELHKVPSALSYTVAQLESSLGLCLFDRTGRKLRLTAIGRDLLTDGRRLLRIAGDIERRLTQMSSGWETQLRIAVDTIFGLQVLYPLIPAFDLLRSGTRLTLREEALAGCWDALENDRADLIIGGMGAGGLPSGGGYDIHVLGRLAFDYAVAPNHPLAALAERIGAPLADEDIHPFRAVSVADTSLVQSPRTIGLLAGQDTLTVATMRDKVAAQVAGLGVGFLPRFLAEREFRSGSLVRVRVQQPRPEASFCIAHRPGAIGNAGRWFIDRLSADPGLLPMLESHTAISAR